MSLFTERFLLVWIWRADCLRVEIKTILSCLIVVYKLQTKPLPELQNLIHIIHAFKQTHLYLLIWNDKTHNFLWACFFCVHLKNARSCIYIAHTLCLSSLQKTGEDTAYQFNLKSWFLITRERVSSTSSLDSWSPERERENERGFEEGHTWQSYNISSREGIPSATCDARVSGWWVLHEYQLWWSRTQAETNSTL